MATAPIGFEAHDDPLRQTQQYTPVGDVDPFTQGHAELSPAEQMDRYFDLREAAKAQPVPSEQVIARIQRDVDRAVNIETGLRLRDELNPATLPYGQYDHKAVARFRKITDYLRRYHSADIPEEVLDASDAFIDMATGMYDAYMRGETVPDALRGRSGFVVPARASRDRPQDSVETIDPCPILRYVPPELRIAMFAGLPPFVVDRYMPDAHGKYAYMLLAPVYQDSIKDLGSVGRSMAVGQAMVNETVQFGRKMLGIRVFGLGATLPMVTRFGESIPLPNSSEADFVTTTGHGGTIALILKTVQALRERGAVAPGATQRIGILGAAGSIGSSIFEVMAMMYPGAEITIFDPKATKALDEQVARLSDPSVRDGRITLAKNARDVLEGSDIIISAVTGAIDLKALGVRRRKFRGHVLIDDSQPWAFSRNQVEEYGGREVWVAGENPRGDIVSRVSSWNYGGTLLPNSVFGCEAEVNVLAALLADTEQTFMQDPYAREQFAQYISAKTGKAAAEVTPLDVVRDMALRRRVTPRDAMNYVQLFDYYGIGASSRLQAEGKPTTFPRRHRLLRGLARLASRHAISTPQAA